MFTSFATLVFSPMDINDVRRRNLRRLVTQYDSQADLARTLAISPQALSGVLTGNKPFGEKFARSLEQTLKLAPGWLDRNGGSDETGPGLAGLDDAVIRLAQRIQELTPRDRSAVTKLVDSLRASP